MKKLTVKTKEIVSAYKALDNAKYTRMSDADKLKVWKIYRQFKPIVLECSEAVNDAKEKLAKDDGSLDLVNKALEELFDKEVTLEFEPLSSEAFNNLLLSSDMPLSWLDKIALIQE